MVSAERNEGGEILQCVHIVWMSWSFGVLSRAQLSCCSPALQRMDPTPYCYRGEVHNPGKFEASAAAASKLSSASRSLMAISVITVSCEHSDVPRWQMKSSQEMGRTLESLPKERG